MRSVLALTIFLGMASAAVAETNRQNCALMADPMTQAAAGLRALYTSTEAMGLDRAIDEFSGEEKVAYQELEQLRLAMSPDLKAFVDKLEDISFQMKRCAR